MGSGTILYILALLAVLAASEKKPANDTKLIADAREAHQYGPYVIQTNYDTNEPGQLGSPRQPGTLGQPGQPEYPGQPSQPGQRGYPVQPGQPGQSGQPRQPAPPGPTLTPFLSSSRFKLLHV